MDAEDEGEASLMMMRGDQEDRLPYGRTMRHLVALHEGGLHILVDTGVTHNIIDESLALRLGLTMRRFQMRVTISTDDRIISRDLPLVIEWEVFFIDGYTFPLVGDTNIILGTPWLCSLGPILWDFARLESKSLLLDRIYDGQFFHLPSNPLLTSTISEKLSKANHALWKAQVRAAIRGARLDGHLTGASKAPDAEIKDKDRKKVPNPAFEEWDAVDQQILSFLLSSLSREILIQVSTASTAAQAWRSIEDIFGSQTRARTVNLRIALSTTKKGSSTVAEYFAKMKSYGDDMAAAGRPYPRSVSKSSAPLELVFSDVWGPAPDVHGYTLPYTSPDFSGLQAKISSGGFVKNTLFNLTYKFKQFRMLRGAKHNEAAAICDKVAFSKVKEGLGGNVRVILSGAAPLATHVEEYLRVVTCAHVIQGYGLTETCAGSFVSLPNQMSMIGTVGPPVPNIDVCLESVPEMDYDALASSSNGQICIRGETLFSGYYKREDLTKEVLVDGWFHTGDIGEWQPDGIMKIIDRKKNIFKLSQGEYVAVENLENIYALVSAIDSIWVYGSSFESFLVAVINPNKEALESWAAANGIDDDFEALCQNPKAKEYFLGELSKIGKEKKLKGFEFIKDIHLEPVPFDMDRDLITPTYKKKRPQLLKYYQGVIDNMYKRAK
ncbi:uncharacterized protein LOC133884494 [Phragmites australis]|uniref:uncharacterized protein LOC133884494 n=1 Tax=Phragmites australis TaxID=29695 RepID=UPI002D796251|nr:uncharacterized protein LOC133884494 [Phragmites australis]